MNKFRQYLSLNETLCVFRTGVRSCFLYIHCKFCKEANGEWRNRAIKILHISEVCDLYRL